MCIRDRKTRVVCEACGKTVSLHTLTYRHLCKSMIERVRRKTQEGQAAVQARAEAQVEAEQAAKYSHLFQL
eukprot:4920618-Alexandrium_andersonii.AAC.1